MAEAIISLAVLAVAVAVVGKLSGSMTQGIHERETSWRLSLELTNLRETVGSWRFSEVTVDKIQAIPISPWLSERVDDPRWKVEVTEETELIKAKRVRVALQCEIQGQLATPDALTFWVPEQGGAP